MNANRVALEAEIDQLKAMIRASIIGDIDYTADLMERLSLSNAGSFVPRDPKEAGVVAVLAHLGLATSLCSLMVEMEDQS